MSNPVTTSPASDLYKELIHQCAIRLIVTLISKKKRAISIPFAKLQEFLEIPDTEEYQGYDIATMAEWLAQIQAEVRTATLTEIRPFFIDSQVDKVGLQLRLNANPSLINDITKAQAKAVPGITGLSFAQSRTH